jgi:anti-sigma factor RsiW
VSDIACVSGVELLIDYLEGVLLPEVNIALEAHVAGCERCAAFIASYQATPRILRAATEIVLPADIQNSLHAFLRTLRR